MVTDPLVVESRLQVCTAPMQPARLADTSNRRTRATAFFVYRGRPRASSGRQPMLIKWPVPVIKNRVQRRQIWGVRIQPSVYVLRLDGNNASVMTRCRDFRWWLVRYGRKRQQVRLARCRPTGPQTCDEHVACRIRPEFENGVFVFLAYRKIAAFHSCVAHVLVKRIDDN